MTPFSFWAPTPLCQCKFFFWRIIHKADLTMLWKEALWEKRLKIETVRAGGTADNMGLPLGEILETFNGIELRTNEFICYPCSFL